ncbi:hypothetical protein VCHC62A1_1256A, partial [Vibrio cholerae HC-62A1]
METRFGAGGGGG